MASRAEREFHADMVLGSSRLKKEIGYNPTRFNQMVAEHGGVGAAHLLLQGADASDGFTTLWEHGRLEMSVEAVVLVPWYADLFTNDERAIARRRLTDHRFDVDGYVARRALDPPSWATSESEG